MTNCHCINLRRGKSVGKENVIYFYWASAIAMPESVVIRLVSDDDDSLTNTELNIENEISHNVNYCDFSRYELKVI